MQKSEDNFELPVVVVVVVSTPTKLNQRKVLKRQHTIFYIKFHEIPNFKAVLSRCLCFVLHFSFGPKRWVGMGL